jgi:hypothetical protein
VALAAVTVPHEVVSRQVDRCETARCLGADLVVFGNGHGDRWHPTIRRKPVWPALDRRLNLSAKPSTPSLSWTRRGLSTAFDDWADRR